MYKVFYGFTNPPFARNVKPADSYQHSHLKELGARFDYIKKYRGIMLLTGEPGTGKTTALRHFIASLQDQFFFPVYIPLATVGIVDFYKQLNDKLGGDNVYSKSLLFKSIQNRILDLATNQSRVPVIVIDESHFLKIENFYELQIISNFQLDSFDPCIFILSAQSHLNDRLGRSVLNSFNQRINMKYHLQPLGMEDCKEYVLHSFRQNGVSDPVFTEPAFAAIYNISGGVLRVIGKLVTKALFYGASCKKRSLSEEDILVATKEL